MEKLLFATLCLGTTYATFAQVPPDTLPALPYRLLDVHICKCPLEGYKVDPAMERISPYPFAWDSILKNIPDSLWLLKEEEEQPLLP